MQLRSERLLLREFVENDFAELRKVTTGSFGGIGIYLPEKGDLIMLGIGGFTPLNGFMTHADWQGVCDGMRMPNGLFWPIPITLSTTEALAATCRTGQDVTLVDAAGVGLAEAELAPLGEEPLGAAQALVVLLLVLVARRCAVDDHGGPLQGLPGLEAHLVPQLLELRADVVVHRQVRAALDQVVELGPVGGERRPFVEGDFVDSHAVAEIGEETEHGLANRARAHDVRHLLPGRQLRRRRHDSEPDRGRGEGREAHSARQPA